MTIYKLFLPNMENNEWNQACQEVFKNGSEYNKI